MTLPTWISYEPAIWLGVIEAALVLLIAFGIPITGEQKVAVLGFSSALIALIGSVVVRSQVTPTAKLAN